MSADQCVVLQQCTGASIHRYAGVQSWASRVQVQNSGGDMAGLPSPQEAADKLKGKVDEVGRNVQGAGSNNPPERQHPQPPGGAA